MSILTKKIEESYKKFNITFIIERISLSKDIETRAREHFISEFGEVTGEKFFNSMIKYSKEKMVGIDQSIEEENREELMRFFHSLKGLMLQGGLNEISEVAKALERDAKDGMDFDLIKSKKEELLIDLEDFLAQR